MRRDGDAVQVLEGAHPILEALRARRRPLFRLRLPSDARSPGLDALEIAAREAGVPIEKGGDGGGRGPALALEAGPLPELSLPGLVDSSSHGGGARTLVALDGVEDPQNLGALVRVAEGAGVRGLVLTRRRAPPLSPAVSRASAGAIEWLPVARVPNLPRALRELKERGFWVFGADAEEGDDLFRLPDRTLQGDRVVVLGAEDRGIGREVGRALDHRVKIPMAGRIASLNVSAAGAVILFELSRRQGLADLP